MPGQGGRGGRGGGPPPRWGPNGPGGGYDFEPLGPFELPANTDPTPPGEDTGPMSRIPNTMDDVKGYYRPYTGEEYPFRGNEDFRAQQETPLEQSIYRGQFRGANDLPEGGEVSELAPAGEWGEPGSNFGNIPEAGPSAPPESFWSHGNQGEPLDPLSGQPENTGIDWGLTSDMLGGAMPGVVGIPGVVQDQGVDWDPSWGQSPSFGDTMSGAAQGVGNVAGDAYDWATGGNSGNDNPGGEYMPGNEGGGWDQPQEWWSEPSYGGAPAQPDYQPDWGQPQQDWSPQYEGTGNSGDYSDPYQDWSPEYEGTGGSGGWDNGGGGDDWGGAPMDSGNGGISGGSGQFGAGDFGGSSVNFNDLLSLMDFYGGGGGCFAAGTPIRMADGSEKPIEKIEVGDKVLAYDEKARELQPAEVAKLHVHENHPICQLAAGKHTLTTTKEHRFYIEGEWKALRDVEPGSKFLAFNPESKELEHPKFSSLAWSEPEWRATVYNLTLKTVHTFFAGGLLVHNTKDTFGGEDTSWRFGGD